MAKSEDGFWAAYAHPLWRKRREEIIRVSGCICWFCSRRSYWCHDCESQGYLESCLQPFRSECERCGCRLDNLEVHHRHYVTGRKPWEYADDELVATCSFCHEKVTNFIRGAKGYSRWFLSGGCTLNWFKNIVRDKLKKLGWMGFDELLDFVGKLRRVHNFHHYNTMVFELGYMPYRLVGNDLCELDGGLSEPHDGPKFAFGPSGDEGPDLEGGTNE